MVKIGLPSLTHNKDYSELRCTISADYLERIYGVRTKEIWFKTLAPFGEYLVDEVGDSFLLATILPALRHGEDIEIEGNVSERLYFNTLHTLIYILRKSFKTNPVSIKVGGTVRTSFGGLGVGCGCSLGIDSLAAIFSHIDTPETPDYQITHLTYFNVGSHGYKDPEANRCTWLKDMVRVEQFAKELSLPVVKIESNVWELFDGFNFDQSGNLINMATVLSMQKLFGRYLYGSNHPVEDFRLIDRALGFFESVMIPNCSTESTELIVANADMTRADKTEIVAQHTMSHKNLYVCWKELIVNNNPNHPIARIKDKYLNCTRCDKCLRTCAQLDILGVLDEYKEIFDIEHFRNVREVYFGRALAQRGSNTYYADIINMANRHNYKITAKSKFVALLYKLHLIGVVNRFRPTFHKL